MALSAVFGKYILVAASVGISSLSPLVYSAGGSFLGGGSEEFKSQELIIPKKHPLETGSISAVSVEMTEDRNSKSSTPQEVVTVESKLLQPPNIELPARTSDSPSVLRQEKQEYRESPEAISDIEIQKIKGKEAQKLEKAEADEFLTPFLKTLETPMYYRGYLSLVNKVIVSAPKNVLETPSGYWAKETNNAEKDRFLFFSNKEKQYPWSMDVSYRALDEVAKFKSLGEVARKWFGDWGNNRGNDTETFYDFYYEIKEGKGRNSSEVIFWRYFGDKWYSLEVEYAFESNYYKGPMLQLGYVWYKDTSWWRGGYYSAEGGRGYQRHIGAVGNSAYGNAESTINRDWVETFEGNDISKYLKWWKVLAACSEDEYCKATLAIPSSTKAFVEIPLDKYREISTDKWYEDFHPLQLQYRKVDASKLNLGKLKHINTLREVKNS